MPELLVVLLIVLLVFGASRLPAIGEGLGKAIKGLKRGIATDDDIEVRAQRSQVTSKSSAEDVPASKITDAEVAEEKK
jgi:sec-independent protein translocase protein TatA